MPRRSRRARPDANQPAVFDGIRKAGHLVQDTSAVGYGFPDGIIGCSWGQLMTIEVKTEDGELRPSQVAWAQLWRRTPRVVARSVKDALKQMSALRK